MTGPPPIDRQRVGRIVYAQLDGDEATAEAVANEAVDDGRVPELAAAALAALIGFLRLTAGVDNAKQWAADWILHAHMEDQAQQLNN